MVQEEAIAADRHSWDENVTLTSKEVNCRIRVRGGGEDKWRKDIEISSENGKTMKKNSNDLT